MHHAANMPLDHLVILKLKPDISKQAESALFAAVRSLTLIPGVIDASVGRNWVPEGAANRGGGFTHGISVRFDNPEALMPYQVHPLHVQARAVENPHHLGFAATCALFQLPLIFVIFQR